MSIMSATIPPKKRATVDEFLARVANHDRVELVDGEIVEQAISGAAHSLAMAAVTDTLHPFRRKPGDPRGLGGWWLCIDLGIQYPNGDIYAHDLSGFRRDQHAGPPEGFPVELRPDWACEVLSHDKRDLVVKPRTLHAARVPHYWVIDHVQKLLFVHRWSPDGYVVALRASAGDTARAEPFDAIEIQVSDLFGDD